MDKTVTCICKQTRREFWGITRRKKTTKKSDDNLLSDHRRMKQLNMEVDTALAFQSSSSRSDNDSNVEYLETLKDSKSSSDKVKSKKKALKTRLH